MVGKTFRFLFWVPASFQVEQWSLANGTRLDWSLNHLKVKDHLTIPKRSQRIARPRGQAKPPQPRDSRPRHCWHISRARRSIRHFSTSPHCGPWKLRFKWVVYLKNKNDAPQEFHRASNLFFGWCFKGVRSWLLSRPYPIWVKKMAGFADLEPLVKVKRLPDVGSTMIQCIVATFHCSFLD